MRKVFSDRAIIRRIIFSCACVFLCFPGIAQIYLQLERSGSFKTTRYTSGDELVFKLVNDDAGWHRRTIVHLDPLANTLLLSGMLIPLHLDSIAEVKLEGTGKLANVLGTSLQLGGINMILFSLTYTIYLNRNPNINQSLDWETIVSGLGSIAVGTAIRRIFRERVFKPGKRKRVRIIDLSFDELPRYHRP